MPLIMAVTLLVQAQLAPMSPSMDPGQQKMIEVHAADDAPVHVQPLVGIGALLDGEQYANILQTKLTRMQNDPVLAEAAKQRPDGTAKKKK